MGVGSRCEQDRKGGEYGKSEKAAVHPRCPRQGMLPGPPGPHAGVTHLPRDQSRKCNREDSAPATPSAALVGAGKQGGHGCTSCRLRSSQAASLILYSILNIFSTFDLIFFLFFKEIFTHFKEIFTHLSQCLLGTKPSFQAQGWDSARLPPTPSHKQGCMSPKTLLVCITVRSGPPWTAGPSLCRMVLLGTQK